MNPKLKPEIKKNHFKNVRLNDAEKRMIEKRSQQLNKKPATYLRDLFLSDVRTQNDISDEDIYFDLYKSIERKTWYKNFQVEGEAPMEESLEKQKQRLFKSDFWAAIKQAYLIGKAK